MGMSPLKATYTDENGDDQTIDAHDIANQLKAKGAPVLGYTPDGSAITYQTPQGQPGQMPLDTAMAKLGYQVKDMQPDDNAIDDSNVNIGYRLGIKYLQNDQDKKDYLQAKLAKEGQPNANVIGSGSKFYTFDPNKGMYRALTSGQGLGMADVADHGIDAAQTALDIAPEALGIAGGPIGEGLASAAGSAIGDTLARGGIAAMDPDAAARMNVGDQAEETAMNAAGAGVLGGAAAKLGLGPDRLKPPSALNRAVSAIAPAAINMGFKSKTKGTMGPLSEEDGSSFLDTSAVNTVGKRKSLM